MKKQIKKISENKYQIITPKEPIIEEVSIGDIKNELERLETEKIDFETKNSFVLNRIAEIVIKIDELKSKIEEIKKIK